MAKLTQSYVHGASATPLIGETIGNRFDQAVERWPEHEALVVRHQGIRWRYRELKQEVDGFAAGLLALGLEPGDRVGIWSPNNAEWVVTQFATAKAGLVLVNINPAYRLSELEYALNKVGCKALVTAVSFKGSDYVAMLRELAPEIDRCAPGHISAEKLPPPARRYFARRGPRRGYVQLCQRGADGRRGAVTASRRPRRHPPVRRSHQHPDHPAAPPAFPRGRRSPITIYSTTAISSGEAMRLSAEDRLCIPVPLYHCFGMVLGNSRLSHPRIGHGLSRRGVRAAGGCSRRCRPKPAPRSHGVPTMFIAELDHPGF